MTFNAQMVTQGNRLMDKKTIEEIKQFPKDRSSLLNILLKIIIQMLGKVEAHRLLAGQQKNI